MRLKDWVKGLRRPSGAEHVINAAELERVIQLTNPRLRFARRYVARLAPSIDDVIDLAEPVLKHRMALTFAARSEKVEMSDVVARLVEPLG